jgi:hypothetical protein
MNMKERRMNKLAKIAFTGSSKRQPMPELVLMANNANFIC